MIFFGIGAFGVRRCCSSTGAQAPDVWASRIVPTFRSAFFAALAASFFAIPSASADITTTGAMMRIEWSVTGISDSQLQLVRVLTNSLNYYHAIYSAPLRVLQSAEADVTAVVEPIIVQTNYFIFDRQIQIDIPYGSTVWRTELKLKGSATNPPTIHQSHRDLFAPNQSWPGIRLRFTGRDMRYDYLAISQHDIYVDIIPEEAFQIGYYKWLQGLPEFSGFRFAKPGGCGGCQPMGLPTFQVNPSTLNLVVQDTDFSYSGLGPPVELTRTWNADTEWIGMFGRGWRFKYESFIQDSPASAGVSQGDGQVLSFPLDIAVIGTNVAQLSGSYTIVTITNGSSVAAAIMPGGYPTNWNGLFRPPVGSRDRLTYRKDPATGRHEYRLYEKATDQTWLYTSTNLFRTNALLASVHDAYTNQIVLQRNAQGWLTNLVDAAGRSVRFTYNAHGRCTTMTIPGRGSAYFAYSTNHNLISSQDFAGNVTLFAYDTLGFMTNMSTEGRTWSFSWDDYRWRKIYQVVDPFGKTNTYYVSGGLADINYRYLRRTDPGGNNARTMSSGGFVTSHEARDGGYTSYTYNNGMVESERNPLTRTRYMAYDERNNLIQHTDPAGGIQRFAYDDQDRLLVHSNELGFATRFFRNAAGSVTQQVWPSGRTVAMTYNAVGQLLARRDPAGSTNLYTYDAFGNLRSFTDGEGYTTRFAYDATGMDLVAVTNARGFATRFEYDANRRLTRIIHPDGTDRQIEYDCCAQTGVVDENGARTWVTRDHDLRVLTSTDPLGRTTRFAYDVHGQLIARTNALGGVRTFGYDPEGRLVAITNELGDVTMIYRNKMGHPVVVYLSAKTYPALTPAPSGKTTVRYTYDGANRLWTMDAPSTTYDRDLRGRITRRTTTARFTYDEDDRLLTVSYSGVLQSTNTYDAAGNLRSSTCAEGLVQFEYDRRNLVTGLVHRNGRRTTMRYDANGNVAEIAQPGSVVAVYQRDARDRITNLLWNGQSVAFAYDAAGRLIRETRSNGTQSLYTYDAAGNALTLRHDAPVGTLLDIRLQRDALYRTTNIVHQGGLLPATPTLGTGQFAAVYNSYLQLATLNGNGLTYDARWNLTAVTGAVAFAAAYDMQARPLSITLNGVQQTYAYDGLGHRIKRTLEGETRYAYYTRNGRLLYETDAADNVVRRFVYAEGRLIAMATSDATYFYHFDANGNTVCLTDSQGAVAAHYRYLPDGTSGGAFSRVENPFTFSGRFGIIDDGGGLYFMRNRTYFAPLRRFLQPDPSGLLGGEHGYAYAGGNPVDYIDPSGLKPTKKDAGGLDPFAAMAGAVSAALDGPNGDFLSFIDDAAEWIDTKQRARDERQAATPCVITPEEAAEFQRQFDMAPDSFDPQPAKSGGDSSPSPTFSIPEPNFPEFSLDED